VKHVRCDGRRYPELNQAVDGSDEITLINVQGQPIYDELIRGNDYTCTITDLLRDDGEPRGVRGWRLA
jgi:hypothetical protein